LFTLRVKTLWKGENCALHGPSALRLFLNIGGTLWLTQGKKVENLLNAIFRLLHNGCQRPSLPNDLAPWQSTCVYFRCWANAGPIERIRASFAGTIRAQSHARRWYGPCFLSGLRGCS
jgi:transposase